MSKSDNTYPTSNKKKQKGEIKELRTVFSFPFFREHDEKNQLKMLRNFESNVVNTLCNDAETASTLN